MDKKDLFQKQYKGELDWELLKKIIPFAEFMKFYHHYRVDGVFKIPKTGRAMILVNHSLATYDILLLGYSIFDKIGRLPRGLADSNFYKNTLTSEFANKLGMYEANHENAENVLNGNEILMLAPGGTKEAIRSSEEKFKIKWDDRKGFARLSIKTQSPIILAACPGADNVYTVKASPITDFAYKFFKLPITFAEGIGKTILPRPVKLVHYIHEPIFPPPFEGENPDDELVKEYHLFIVNKMTEWMETHTKIFNKLKS